MSNVSWTECILTTWLEKSQGVWYHMSDKTRKTDHSFLLNDVPNVSWANLFASLIMYTAMSVYLTLCVTSTMYISKDWRQMHLSFWLFINLQVFLITCSLNHLTHSPTFCKNALIIQKKEWIHWDFGLSTNVNSQTDAHVVGITHIFNHLLYVSSLSYIPRQILTSIANIY